MSKKPVIYIVYNKRSCVTGKALFDSLKRSMPRVEFRRSVRDNLKKIPDAVIRWGNSTTK